MAGFSLDDFLATFEKASALLFAILTLVSAAVTLASRFIKLAKAPREVNQSQGLWLVFFGLSSSSLSTSAMLMLNRVSPRVPLEGVIDDAPSRFPLGLFRQYGYRGSHALPTISI